MDAIIMAADATTDAITAGDFPAEITPAAISCGSLSYCVCAAITDADVTMDVATATAAGSSLYCFCSAAMAADVDADNHFIQAEGRSLCLFSGCRPLRTNYSSPRK